MLSGSKRQIYIKPLRFKSSHLKQRPAHYGLTRRVLCTPLCGYSDAECCTFQAEEIQIQALVAEQCNFENPHAVDRSERTPAPAAAPERFALRAQALNGAAPALRAMRSRR